MKTSDIFLNISMEDNAFNELIQDRLIIKEQYSKEMNKLIKKKEDLWIEKDINKWNITNYDNIDRLMLIKDKEYAFSKMCTVDTQNLINLHNKLNYTNYTNNEQLKMIIKLDILHSNK